MNKIMIAATATMMLCAATAQAQEKITTSQFEEYVQVSGSAEKEVIPDEIYLQIVINENDTKGKVSVEKAEQEMIAKLKALGIDTDKNLSIGDMGSDLKKFLLRKNQARTNATYELKVSDAAMLGKVFQTLESMGITDINITRLNYSKMKELRNELRVEAMKDAQEIAQTLAGAVGQSIREAVYIVDYNTNVMPRENFMMKASRAADAGSGLYETELDFRKIKVSHNVTVKFRLWYK